MRQNSGGMFLVVVRKKAVFVVHVRTIQRTAPRVLRVNCRISVLVREGHL